MDRPLEKSAIANELRRRVSVCAVEGTAVVATVVEVVVPQIVGTATPAAASEVALGFAIGIHFTFGTIGISTVGHDVP